MDKPDYGFWEKQPSYSFLNAAALCCDIDPQDWQMHSVKVKAMLRRLEREVDRDGPDCFGDPSANRVLRHTLIKWAERNGERPPFLFPEARADNQTEWGFTHDTRLLRIVREVIRNEWEGRDPARCPSKESVVEDLMAKHNLSKNEAEAVDLVTRHDSRRRSPTK